MRKLSLVGFVRIWLAIATVVASLSAALAQDRPRVVAVNQALQSFAEQLLGDAADVVFLVPEGVDPSFWRPSIADISAVQSADLILLNGAGFATWVDRVSLPRSRVVNTSKSIEDQFIYTETITHSHGDGGEHSHEGVASYTWLDPMLAIAQAEAIAAAVIARDLAPAEDVETRLDRLRSDLTDLDKTSQDALSGLEGVAIIATHPRYQYFARRYGLMIASLEWDAGATPSAEDLADLKAHLAQNDARVLLWEAHPSQEATALTEALGLNNVVFEPWASAGSQNSFIEAYKRAVLELSEAARQSSN
ncbi:MAG: metal ABC transporter substrate-binding protein [Rhodobacteraceae bacterium]|nr:metal ABC transporter substrate-binding protein [Paracoccaceae bacterium]